MADITPALIKELRELTGVGMGKCKEALEATSGNLQQAIDHLRKIGMASAVKKEGRETKEGIVKFIENGSCLALAEINAETDFVVKNEKFEKFADMVVQEVAKTKPTTITEFLTQKSSIDPNQTIDEVRAGIVQSLGENIQVKKVEVYPKKPNTSFGIYSHMGGKLVCVVEIEGSDSEQALAKEIAMHIAAESPDYLNPEEVPERIVEHEKEIARAQIQGKPPQIVEKILEGKLKAYYDQVCLVKQKFVKDPNISIEEFVARRSKEISKPLKISQFLRWKVGG